MPRAVDLQPYYCGVSAPDTSAGGGDTRTTKYLMFGYSLTQSFQCDLSSLLGEEAYFYDPYIVDEASRRVLSRFSSQCLDIDCFTTTVQTRPELNVPFVEPGDWRAAPDSGPEREL